MLQKILSLIEQGRQRSQTELAKALDVSPTLLDEMIAQLTHQGYLQDLSNCDTTCGDCSLKGGCFMGATQHIWVLTPKGRHAVAALPHA
jgi:predicted ArsR family transcriptional regulator